MQVELRVYSGLEKFTSTRYGELIPAVLNEGSTIRDLINLYNIPEEEVFTALVNGLHKSFDDLLQEGDRVAFFPPVGGG